MKEVLKFSRAFWYVYKNSLYNIKYYKDILKVKRRFSLKYFLVLAGLATIITTTRIAIPLIPRVSQTTDKLISVLSSSYPKDLIITSKNGDWSINQPEPYTIKTPAFFRSNKGGNFPENLITFDHKGTINDLRENDTLMLLNDANVLTVNNQNRIEAYPLDNMPNGQIDQQKFDSVLNNLRGYLGIIPVLVAFFLFLGTLFYFLVFRLLYLLVIALVLLAVGNIKKSRYTFSDYYRIALHAITLPLTLELLFILLGTTMLVPFSFLAINIFYGITIVFYLTDSK